MSSRIVLVGGGLASAAAAHTLRDAGFGGRITLVSAEPHLPYERPPLSKEYLRGEVARDDLPFPAAEWYETADLDLRLGVRATRIDVATREVELDDGVRLAADAVLLATGGVPRRLDGAEGERICYLRTIEDADRIAALLGPGRRLVVVGAGFIGAEVAASARKRQTEVTVVEALDVPLQRVLGRAIGRRLGALHREHGTELRTGESVRAIAEISDGVVVTTGSGDRLRADAAVVGVGIVPETSVADASGIHVGDGIVVDPACRTRVEGVYAAGDVAEHEHPLFGRRLRVEHYDNALRQGAAAARSMLGEEVVYDDPHWFWSDQYEHNLQLVGDPLGHDDVVVRGASDGAELTAFYLRDGVVRAVFAVDRARDVRAGRRLVAARARPERDALADENIGLRDLVRRL